MTSKTGLAIFELFGAHSSVPKSYRERARRGRPEVDRVTGPNELTKSLRASLRIY